MEILKEYISNINIPYQSFQKYYNGTHPLSRVFDIYGVSIDIPNRLLIPHLTQSGINGRFLITNRTGSYQVLRMQL